MAKSGGRQFGESIQRCGKKFLTLLLAMAFVSFTYFSFSQGFAQTPVDEHVFLVKPYIQFGDLGKLSAKESMEVVWFSSDGTEDWKVESKQKQQDSWRAAKKIHVRRMGQIGGNPYFRFVAEIDELAPGEQFSYRLQKIEKPVFESSSIARKNFNQPYRFAVVGDIGAGSPGEKRIAHEIVAKKPDFLMVPGDVVYSLGRVSEYFLRFFPIMNCDTDSPGTGAPLLRTIPVLAAIGNHDVAMTSVWEGTDFTAYPDALGFFIFWSQPLNGPNRLANEMNTPIMIGDAGNQANFVNAAGKRYPVMANYSFDYGNSHWIVLDGNPYMDWTNERMRQWVEKDLENAKNATWKFACFHQPGFSADRAHSQEQRMRLLSDIFERQNVDIVFSGHAHNYQRTFPLKFKPTPPIPKGPVDLEIPGTFQFDKKFDTQPGLRPDGVIYIVTGGGGAALYMKANDVGEFEFLQKFNADSHSFTICDIKGGELKLTQFSDEGKPIDQFVVSKPKEISGNVAPGKIKSGSKPTGSK